MKKEYKDLKKLQYIPYVQKVPPNIQTFVNFCSKDSSSLPAAKKFVPLTSHEKVIIFI